ncbi:MAG: hypothetical protein Q3979_05630 [Actinomycetaceae bacterium]|nr:hypothetical protein [Actinomycetaceae bacterium]
MDPLATAIAAGDTGGTRFAIGRVRTSRDGVYVTVQGSPITTTWATGLTVRSGDLVLVAMIAEPLNQSSAVVLCRLADKPSPSIGTIKDAATPPLVVVSTDMGDIQATLIGDSARAGTTVALVFQGHVTLAIPRPGLALPSRDIPDTVAPPPAAATRGTIDVIATSSGAFDERTGAWDPAGNPTQGAGYSGPFVGAWFYGYGFAAAHGTTVTAARINIGARRRDATSGTPVTLTLQAHLDIQPGGRPAIDGATTEITLPSGASAGWHDLPPSIAQTLVDRGGGIALVGDEYAAIDGVATDAQSGQIQIDWRT